MPLFFLFAGIILLTAVIRGKEATDELFAVLQSDFTGPNNFFVWSLAIASVAALGYSAKLRPFSNAMLALVFVALILGRAKGRGGKSFFTDLYDQIRSTEGK